MELRHLRHFIAIADRLSFSKAAQSLHITQPALSRQIRDLEEELGCTLFHRRPTEIQLTPEGEYLRERAAALLRMSDDLIRELQARGKGKIQRIRLAHFGTFLELYLVPFIHRLHRRHPRWQVDLLELAPAEALRQLERGEIDAAAMSRPASDRLAAFSTRVFWREQPLIVVPANHALAKRRHLKLRDLAKERLLLWDEEQYPGFSEPFVAACRSAGFEPVVAQTVDSVASVFTAVARDGTIGYVGRLAGQLPTPGVTLVPLANGELDLPTLLAWRPDAPGAAIIAELADALAEQPPAKMPRADS